MYSGIIEASMNLGNVNQLQELLLAKISELKGFKIDKISDDDK